MNRYAIFGAGGYGREVMPVAKHNLQTQNQPWDLVFVDDNPSANLINGHRVLTYAQWLLEPANARFISLAVSSGEVREKLSLRCIADGVNFFELRAPNVMVMDDVVIGQGALLSPFVTLTSNIRIGQHFHANLYSYVAHDCVIGDFVTFAPGVHCNGNVIVEDHVYIGTSAIIKNGIVDQPLIIGKGSIVGMGAVVTKSVAPKSTVVGNPARVRS